MNNILLAFIVFLITSCVWVPKKSENQPYANDCKMVTKKYSLTPEVKKKYSACNVEEFAKEGPICLVLAGVVASASAVVSGSLVLVGNTIHWSEYKLSCQTAKVKN